MKKGLKIFLYVLCGAAGCYLCLLLYFVIYLFNFFTLKEVPRNIYEKSPDYIDMNASEAKQLTPDIAAEYEGNLYCIDPESHLLYQISDAGERTQISSSPMDQLMLIDNSIAFCYEDELMVQNRSGDEVIKISDLGRYTSPPTYLDGKLYFINGKAQLCTYDFQSEKSKILVRNTSDFRIYGRFIYLDVDTNDLFNSHRFDGIYAMELDGSTIGRITDATSWDFEVYQNYIFLTNESNQTYRVDMQSRAYIEFPKYNEFIELQLVNEKMYYRTGEDKNGDGYPEDVFIETDLDGGFIRELQTFEYEGECWVESTDQYLYLIIVDSSGDSTVRIFDESGNVVDEIIYEDSRIEEFVCLPDYIVVRLTRDDDTVSYVYDTAFQELGSF